jgi:hypothetical protein
MMHAVFTDTEIDTLLVFSTGLSIISFIGLSFIILSYYLFPNLRKFSFKLVLFMSISDVGVCITYLMGNPRNDTGLCTIQGLLMQFFQISSTLWSTAIALTLYRAVVKRKDSDNLMPYFHAFCYGVPFLFCFLPLFTESYGNTGAWCWITAEEGDDAGSIWRLFIFYLPLWAAISFNAYTYFVTIRSMSNLFKSRGEESAMPAKYKKLIQRLALYPLILVGCWFFATINRIHNFFAPEDPIFWLFFLQVVGQSLQGSLNALAYGLNPNVRDSWVDKLNKEGRCLTIVRVLEHKDGERKTDATDDVDEDGESMSSRGVDMTTQV